MVEKEFDPVRPQLVCVNCGEDIKMVGPETWHVESTMIRCDLPGNDGDVDYKKAAAFTAEAWREFRDYWLKVGERG